MENNFDKRIKEKLENLEQGFPPADWGRMEEMLDAQSGGRPEIDDVLLDGVAYDRLHNLKAAYDPKSWDVLKKKLDDPYAVRHRVVKYKVVEIALLLLFIFTFIQYMPANKEANPDAEPSSTALHAIALDDTENHNYAGNSNEESAGSEAIQQAKQKTVETSSIEATTNQASPSSQALQNKTIPTQVAGVSAIPANEEPNQSAETTTDLAEVASITPAENPTRVLIQEVETVDLKIPELSINVLPSTPSLLGARTAELANIDLRVTELELPTLDKIKGCNLCKTFNSPIRFSVGMVFGPDADYVMSPYNQRFKDNAFNQLTLGYSGGITFGFKYNRWEIETGAMYSAKAYEARDNYEINGSFAEGGYVRHGLVSSELDIVRVPLNLRYNFVHKDKWNVYALSGASVNLAVETLYQYSTKNIGRSESIYERNAIDPHGVEPAAFDGILEGGSILDNTFFTANIGVGVERYFTPRMSAFFQPVYQHQFSKGLGPQEDQINSLSILAGARVSLIKRKKAR